MKIVKYSSKDSETATAAYNSNTATRIKVSILSFKPKIVDLTIQQCMFLNVLRATNQK
jgi:hypothetical protein